MAARSERRRSPLAELGFAFSNVPDTWHLTEIQFGVVQRVYEVGIELEVPSLAAFASKKFPILFLLTTEPLEARFNGGAPDAMSYCISRSADESGNGPEYHMSIVALRRGFFRETVLHKLVALQHELVHLYGRDHTETWVYDDDALARYARRFPKHASTVERLRMLKHSSYTDPEYLKQGLPLCYCTLARRADLGPPISPRH